jgi:ferrous iron transport protein B
MPLLGNLKEGEKGVITKVRGRGAFRKRIMEMGFVKGKEVAVVKAAPLMDPVDYEIMNYEVSLRRSEACMIEVVTMQESGDHITDNGFNGLSYTEILKTKAREKGRSIDVAFVGNPNSGKTTLFNAASKSKLQVANFGGVTVGAHKSRFKYKDYSFNVTDLPGTYSLTEYSPEEIFVRQHILYQIPDIVINVLDASNLERNLYLTTQLIDMDIKVVVALNMYDELTGKGDLFDYMELGRMLGIPFIPTVATKNKGIKELFEKIIEVYEDKDPFVRHVHINYGLDIEMALDSIQNLLWKNKSLTDKISSRYYAIKLLEGDTTTYESIKTLNNQHEIITVAEREKVKIDEQYQESPESLITQARYGFIEGALKETLKPSDKKMHNKSRKLDSFFTNRFLSYPIFLVLMWLMFEATFFIGQYPMKWLEQIIAFIGTTMDQFLQESILKDLLIDGIIGGVGSVLVFLPNILLLFMFISIMEDSGYMARVAFILDKLMHKVGLHGKSFIPLLMGFGCNVPAILSTRTIESKNDRFVTILINPFMSCSARYPVYILLISTFFSSYQGSILFLIYLTGIVLAALMAMLFKKTIFKAKDIPFVMELPPYRMPTFRTTMKHTWYRGSQYLKKMGGFILVASVIIWALGYFPRLQDDGGMSPAMKRKLQQEQSYIGRIGKFIEPAIRPLGFDWKMGVSLIAGSAAKEVVVSTMGVLYQEDDSLDIVQGLSEKISEQSHFTPLVAFSLIAFVLIYLPCIAVLAAVKRETGGWKWAVFLAIYTTGLAWIVSFLIFQIGSLFYQ